MATEPDRDPLGRIDALMDTISRAHLVIFTLHRQLVGSGDAADRARELLRESASILFEQAPEVARAPRNAARDHGLRQLLDPDALLDDEAAKRAISSAEAALTRLLRRQQAIAGELSAIIDRGPTA